VPELIGYTVRVTLEYQVMGNDYGSVVSLAEKTVQPALAGKPGADYPLIRSARISDLRVDRHLGSLGSLGSLFRQFHARPWRSRPAGNGLG